MTSSQLQRVRQIIQTHMNVIMHITIGEGKLSPELQEKLNIPKELRPIIDLAYKYGKLNTLTGKNLKNMPESDVLRLIKDMTLTSNQRKSLEFISMSTGNQITGLTGKITTNVVNSLLQNNMSNLQGVRAIVSDALEYSTDRYKVIQQLREMTGDWSRDWHRVAHTEMWNAKINGEVMAILSNESPVSKKGVDTLVFKRPAPNACAHCKKLYLEKDGITPVVFKLSDMISYGTNYGRKVAEWKPVVGVLHPNCMCTLSVMPDNTTFNKVGQLEFK